VTAADVEAYLHEHIPQSISMGVRVASLDERGVRLTAPLSPNINHRGTVFGGSAAAVAMLAGWALVHAHLAGRPGVRLVIRRQQMEFDAPIDGDFDAVCEDPGDVGWAQFERGLEHMGKGRVQLRVRLNRGAADLATFDGVYVAVSA